MSNVENSWNCWFDLYQNHGLSSNNDFSFESLSLKARKNEVEIRNLIECHIRDSAARVKHMHWMETQMKNGARITEKDVALKLEEIQG